MGGVLWWSIVLLILVVAGFAAASAVKRRLMKPDDAGAVGFNLSDLRALHRAGKMTNEEFEKAKRAILAGALPEAEAPAEARAPSREDRLAAAQKTIAELRSRLLAAGRSVPESITAADLHVLERGGTITPEESERARQALRVIANRSFGDSRSA